MDMDIKLADWTGLYKIPLKKVYLFIVLNALNDSYTFCNFYHFIMTKTFKILILNGKYLKLLNLKSDTDMKMYKTP